MTNPSPLRKLVPPLVLCAGALFIAGYFFLGGHGPKRGSRASRARTDHVSASGAASEHVVINGDVRVETYKVPAVVPIVVVVLAFVAFAGWRAWRRVDEPEG